MQRFIVLLLVAVGLGGCLTTGSPTGGGVVPVEKLRAENKSIVIVHTSLHDQKSSARCDTITATLAQADTNGEYVPSQAVTLKAILDSEQVPSRVALPAGEYGIVGLRCGYQRGSFNYNARIAKRGGIFGTGRTTTYERPIAQFTVAPGEVVDIGSLRVNYRRQREPGAFVAVVTPIPDLWLKSLAEEDPKLFEARVVRPMTVGHDCHLEGDQGRCSVRRPKNG
jgi:hypothetical protein